MCARTRAAALLTAPPYFRCLGTAIRRARRMRARRHKKNRNSTLPPASNTRPHTHQPSLFPRPHPPIVRRRGSSHLCTRTRTHTRSRSRSRSQCDVHPQYRTEGSLRRKEEPPPAKGAGGQQNLASILHSTPSTRASCSLKYWFSDCSCKDRASTSWRRCFISSYFAASD